MTDVNKWALVLGILMLLPGLYMALWPFFKIFVIDSIWDLVSSQQYFRRFRGGQWYYVIPDPVHLFQDNDDIGWRRTPPRKGDLCTRQESY